MFKSIITFPLALLGSELGYNGVLQGEVDLFNFMHGETRNSNENTQADVGSISSGLPSLGNLTQDIHIPKNKFLSEQFGDSPHETLLCVCFR